MLVKVAENVLTYDDVKYMFDNPSSDSWNPRASTAPSHGLYLYDLGYDEEDLALPVNPEKLEQQVVNTVEDSLDIKKEIIKQRIANRRASVELRTSKSLEKIKKYELLGTVKK